MVNSGSKLNSLHSLSIDRAVPMRVWSTQEVISVDRAVQIRVWSTQGVSSVYR